MVGCAVVREREAQRMQELTLVAEDEVAYTRIDAVCADDEREAPRCAAGEVPDHALRVLIECSDVIALDHFDARRQGAQQQRGEVVALHLAVVIRDAAARERAFLGAPERLAAGIEQPEALHPSLHRPGRVERVHPVEHIERDAAHVDRLAATQAQAP